MTRRRAAAALALSIALLVALWLLMVDRGGDSLPKCGPNLEGC